MLKVIGAGFGRTGTHSLAKALEELSFGPCYTLLEIEKNPGHHALWLQALDGKEIDWQTLYEDYQSAVEWPTISFLPQLLRQFPEAKFILTQRDPDSWYESASTTIFPGLEISAQHPDPEIRVRSGLKRRLILEELFSGRYHDKAYAQQIYQDHIQDVIQLIPPKQLLQYQVSDGWGPLCAFLGVPVADKPFPWRNERADFLASAPEWAKKLLASQKSDGLTNATEQ